MISMPDDSKDSSFLNAVPERSLAISPEQNQATSTARIVKLLTLYQMIPMWLKSLLGLPIICPATLNYDFEMMPKKRRIGNKQRDKGRRNP